MPRLAIHADISPSAAVPVTNVSIAVTAWDAVKDLPMIQGHLPNGDGLFLWIKKQLYLYSS
jgi:hypothetical protein